MKTLAQISLLLGWIFVGLIGCSEKSAPKKHETYQCPMHPQVRSDHPGSCSICGMNLVLVSASETKNSSESHSTLVMLPEGAPQATGIRTAEVKREKLTRTLRFAGTIEDNDSRHRILSAYTGGRIEKLFINFEGAEVKAGQPLALFYSPQLLAAEREYALSRIQKNTTISTVGAARLQQMGLTPEQIEKIPERSANDLFFEILAPISGTIVKRVAYEGQYVQAGEKLMEIADFSTMWLQFPAYEQDLPLLKVGQRVEITLPSLPGKTFSAAISFINPTLDMTTRSTMVRVEIPNPESADGKHLNHELLHRTYAEVSVQSESPEVLAVPRSAVLWPGKDPRVYVEESAGNYEQHIVLLGQAGDDFWEVREGLDEGDRVVVSGNMLIDGQAQIAHLAEPTP